MDERFDLFVIGGGINGAAVARDAAGRGLSVALAERDDLAAHTSSASTKLIHGGLRYLEQGAFRLVRESLREREILLHAAPHLVRPLRFTLPQAPGMRPAWMLRIGLMLYDRLGGAKTLPRSAPVRLEDGPLKPAFRRGFAYSDCRVDDARLTVLAAMDARERGARIMTRTGCAALRREGDSWRATLRPKDGAPFDIAARAVVNAAGAWTHDVARAAGAADAPRLRLVKGSHIVTARLWDGETAFILQQPDGRIVFAIPYLDRFTLIGTTDVQVAAPGPGEAIGDDEVSYLCDAVNRYLAVSISPRDVVWAFAGVRALHDVGGDNPSKLSRDDVLALDAGGGAPILSIVGGKLTTHRRVAERVMEKLSPFFPGMGTAWTADAPLPGGDLGAPDFAAFLDGLMRDVPWLEASMARRLAGAYGARARTLLAGAHGPADMGRIHGADLTEREVEYLIAHEFARAAEDVLWRRSKLGLLLSADERAALAERMGDDVTEPLILAIDQGTTSSRAIVFDTRARIVAVAQEEFPQIFPKPGWVEHDPEAIWETTLRTAQAAMREAEAGGGHVQAIGVTNQRETTVIWDRKTLAPIAHAIVWQDRRTSEACAKLRDAGHEAAVTAKTGLVLDPYFSATKIAWLLDAVEDARARAERGELAFGTVDSFLLTRLTGGAHATDATNASRTALYDIRKGGWDDDLLAMFNVPRAVLPEVRDSNAHFGETLAEHFGRKLPVLAMMGDQQAAAFGQACFAPGQVKATYGTGAFIVAQTGGAAPVSRERLLTTIARRIDGETSYALEGSIFVAGAAVQWLRDQLGVITSAPETEDLARGIDGNSGVYFVPAFTGLGAPHWDAEARGAIVGLTRGAGRAELARAALEAAAYQTADLLAAMQRDGAGADVLRVDGGMAANDWMLQFLADMLDAPVERPAVLETTALGAAMLAGIGAGIVDGMDAVAKLRRVDAECAPQMQASEREALMAGWRAALARVTG